MFSRQCSTGIWLSFLGKGGQVGLRNTCCCQVAEIKPMAAGTRVKDDGYTGIGRYCILSLFFSCAVTADSPGN